MLQLSRALIGLAARVAIGWFVPLLATAVVTIVFAIIIAANHWIGGGVVLFATTLLVVYCVYQKMWWQTVVWLVSLLPLAILAFLSPVWALYWALGLELLVLGILLLIPGVVWPTFRRWILEGLIIGALLISFLIGIIITGGKIEILLLGVILLGVSIILFSRSARPWEIRRSKRRTARLLSSAAILLIAGAIAAPVISMIIRALF